MARCSGCSGDRCSCKIVAGSNVLVSGAGTTANPYVIEASTGGGGGGGTTGRLVGEIVAYGGPTAPAGWLICDGSTVSRITYAGLFAVLGTTYGAGDGANTFHLPDLGGRFPIGADGSYPRGSQGGGTATTLTLAHIPSHTHTISHTHTFNHDHGSFSAGPGGTHGHGTPTTNDGQGQHGHVAFQTSDGGAHRHDHPTRHSNSAGNEGTSYNEGLGAPNGTAIPDPDGGLHHHNINVPDGGGGHHHTTTIPTAPDHTHTIDVPYMSGTTSLGSSPNTGSTGNLTPDALDTMPPYTSVVYLIKT